MQTYVTVVASATGIPLPGADSSHHQGAKYFYDCMQQHFYQFSSKLKKPVNIFLNRQRETSKNPEENFYDSEKSAVVEKNREIQTRNFYDSEKSAEIEKNLEKNQQENVDGDL